MDVSSCRSLTLSIHLSNYPVIHLSMYLSINLSMWQSLASTRSISHYAKWYRELYHHWLKGDTKKSIQNRVRETRLKVMKCLEILCTKQLFYLVFEIFDINIRYIHTYDMILFVYCNFIFIFLLFFQVCFLESIPTASQFPGLCGKWDETVGLHGWIDR